MKRLILLLTILIAGLTLQAQKDFEGVITYKLIPPPEGKDFDREIIELDITFAPGKILIKGRGNEDFMEVTLIDLVSGIKFTLVPKDKTYEERPLKRFLSLAKPRPEIVEGYSTTPVEMEASISGILMGGQAVLYFADSLFYHIPPQFKPNPELAMVNKDHILLKGIITLPARSEFDMSIDSSLEATILAFAIKPRKVDPNEMVVPADYTYADRNLMTDSTMVGIDTILAPMDTAIIQKSVQQKPPAKKTPVPPKSKTKTPIKGDLKKEQ